MKDNGLNKMKKFDIDKKEIINRKVIARQIYFGSSIYKE